jgi:ABC-type Mn2+/Zn2+ transport system ATPase subunit
MEEPVLTVQHLTVRMDRTVILEDVSFTLARGSTLAIIGPNGAGKTTLFRALLGLVPYEGRVLWHRRGPVAYIPQRFEFDRTFPLSVVEFFLLKSRHPFWWGRRAWTRRVREALREVNAEPLWEKTLGDLSSGELQRVLIAYALFDDPEVLLFDEPTSGIDAEGEATIYTLLRRIAQSRELSLLIISHDLNVVYEHASQVLCLNRRILCSGSPMDALTADRLRELYRGAVTLYRHAH